MPHNLTSLAYTVLTSHPASHKDLAVRHSDGAKVDSGNDQGLIFEFLQLAFFVNLVVQHLWQEFKIFAFGGL